LSVSPPVARAPGPPGPSLLIVATVAGTIKAFLAPYAAHFRSLGWRVDAAASGAPSDPRLRDSFDHVHELPLSRSLRDVRGLARARRAIQQILETPPDIVHVHTPIASFLTRFVVSRMPPARRPAVAYTAHGFHFHAGGRAVTNAAFLTAERLAGRWTDRLIVISDEDEAAARRHRIVPDRRLVRMPGIGLDTDHYAPSAVPAGSPARIRGQLGIAVDAPAFVIVGELNRNKRQADAIEALGVMQHPGAHLLLAGMGRQRAALEAQARDAGAGDRIHFLGEIDDVRPVVRAATALLLPSRREGLARSIMEALSLEVPVIASTARGNRELLGDDSGLLYDTGDVRGLAGAMDWMLDHPDSRRQMGLRGRARMVERYGLRALIRMHETLYGAMLAERGKPAGAASGRS
jgi:glycosyltransferase involved in cell wall biosynthesis